MWCFGCIHLTDLASLFCFDRQFLYLSTTLCSRVSQPQSTTILCLIITYCGSCIMHCNMFSSVPGLYTLDASSNSPHLPALPTPAPSQCDRQKCVQTFQVSLEEHVVNIAPSWEPLLCQIFLNAESSLPNLFSPSTQTRGSISDWAMSRKIS